MAAGLYASELQGWMGARLDAAAEDEMLIRVYQEVNKIAHHTLMLTLVLELASLPHAMKLMRKDPRLYASAVWKNLLNHYLIAPAMFAFYVRYQK